MDDSNSANDRDGRLFDLGEDLRAALKAGESINAAHWAKRFDLELVDVENALRAMQGLRADALPPLEVPAGLAAVEPNLPSEYVAVNELGRGGMGVVWRAHQTSLDRDVAVKVLMPGELVFGEALERFRREAKSLARLRHRHIVQIHDVGECDGHVYFVMDLIDGDSLATRLKTSGAMNPAQAVHLVKQVASAMSYVHERGIVHRDLKPGNVLVDQGGDAFVVDFGLALDRSTATDLTVTGHLIGTPAYMAPEQVRGDRHQVGEASDIYAMGAILYECLSGRAPFAGLGLMQLIEAIQNTEPRPIQQLRPEVPPALGLIIGKALAKSPADRYPSARALLEDLERFESGRRVLAAPRSLHKEILSSAKRHRTTLIAVAVSVLVTLLALRGASSPSEATSAALLSSARTMQAKGEEAAAGLLYRKAFDDGLDLPEPERQQALLRKLLLGDDDANAQILAESADRGEESEAHFNWLALRLAATHLQGEPTGALAQLKETRLFNDERRRAFAALLPVLHSAATAPQHAAWSAWALDLLETSSFGAVLIEWLAQQDERGDALLLRWLRDGAQSRPSLKAALTAEWGGAKFSDYLSLRGRALLPALLPCLHEGDEVLRAAALHLACAITGLPASPWGGPLAAQAPADSPLQLAEWEARLRAWPTTPPLAWDVELDRLARGTSFDLSADGLRDQVLKIAFPMGVSPDITEAELFQAFCGARGRRRYALHRVLSYRLGQEAPLWPSTASGSPAVEPPSLPNAWAGVLAARSGESETYGLRWAWLDVTDVGRAPVLVEQGRQSLELGSPSAITVARRRPAHRQNPFGLAWEPPGEMPEPRYLGRAAGPDAEMVAIEIPLRAGWAKRSLKLERVDDLRADDPAPFSLRWTSGRWRGIRVGETRMLAELQERGALTRDGRREALLVVFERESQGGAPQPSERAESAWTAEQWIAQLQKSISASLAKPRDDRAMGFDINELSYFADAPLRAQLDEHLLSLKELPRSNDRIWAAIADQTHRPEVLTRIVLERFHRSTPSAYLDSALARFTELGAPIPSGFRWAESKAAGAFKRLIIFLILGGFVGISILFGVVAGLRGARKAGVSKRMLVRATALVLLFSAIAAEALFDEIIWIDAHWVVCTLALAAAGAWWGAIDTELSRISKFVGAMWAAAACLYAYGAWGQESAGGLAWATLLWPLGLFILALGVERHVWQLGRLRWPAALVLAAALVVILGDDLACGLILVLQSFGEHGTMGLAAWLQETRQTWWVSKAAFAFRTSPGLKWLLFHVVWWTVFPSFIREKHGLNPQTN